MARSFDTARLYRRAILFLPVILLASACSDGGDVTAPTPEPSIPIRIDPDPASIVVNSSEIALPVGQWRQIAVTVLDSNGDLIADARPTFTSSDDGIAAVDADGLVRGIAAGDVVITIRAGDLVARVPVSVSRPTVASVSIHPSEFGLVLGRAAPLTVAVLDGKGREIPDAVATFTSDAEQSVTVDASGVVTGVSLGRARITATSEGVSATATAIVTSFIPMEIHLDRTTISVGDRVQVTATQIDEAGRVICQQPPVGNCRAAGHEDIAVGIGVLDFPHERPLAGRQNPLWSSDRNVATINREYVLTGVGRGNATIYAILNPELAGWIPESWALWAWAVVTVE